MGGPDPVKKSLFHAVRAAAEGWADAQPEGRALQGGPTSTQICLKDARGQIRYFEVIVKERFT